jgi:hypothetical protein
MTGADTAGGEGANRATVARARLIAGALVAGVLLLTTASGLIRATAGLGGTVIPAAVLGAVGPVIGFRLYLLTRDRIPRDAPDDRRRAAYLRAVLLALAVTEAAALFGVVVHGLTGNPLALIGVLTHVLLAGAIWPAPERLETFLESPSAGAAGS